MFRQWLGANRVPFNPNAGATDYDMRGFWQAMQQERPMAKTAVDPHDGLPHFPDYWKTPMHQTFSNESQWAGPQAPQWINDAQLADSSGRIKFDARQRPLFPLIPGSR
jgi:hypothetical protein